MRRSQPRSGAFLAYPRNKALASLKLAIRFCPEAMFPAPRTSPELNVRQFGIFAAQSPKKQTDAFQQRPRIEAKVVKELMAE
jgi:hypothetical protein